MTTHLPRLVADAIKTLEALVAIGVVDRIEIDPQGRAVLLSADGDVLLRMPIAKVWARIHARTVPDADPALVATITARANAQRLASLVALKALLSHLELQPEKVIGLAMSAQTVAGRADLAQYTVDMIFDESSTIVIAEPGSRL